MKLLRQLTYITMMLYFLGIVTGGIQSWLANYKLNYTFVPEGEEEANKARSNTQNLIEEDVICHEHYFALTAYTAVSVFNPVYRSAVTLDVLLAMVVPPPEQA